MNPFNHQAGHHLTIDDAKIYYEQAGNPQAQPLLFLHGGLGTLVDFNNILTKLQQEYHLIGIDFRGHGKSTLGTTPLSYELYQSDVEAILKHLGIESVTILGFSDGGIVGYRLAAQSSVEVEKLATLGAQWRITTDEPAYGILSSLTSQEWIGMFPDDVDYYNKVNLQPDFDALVDATVGVWTDLGESGYPQQSVEKIECPTLIARGDEDFLFSLSDAVELKTRIEGSVFSNIPFAGHAAHEDSEDIFTETVNQFLMHAGKQS